MDRIRYARRELMVYNSLLARRNELLEQIMQQDADIKPRLSFLDGMPRGQGGLPKSIVERQVIHREQRFQELTAELERINRRIEVIDKALSCLCEDERTVITRCFHEMEWEDEAAIAKSMKLSMKNLVETKDRALQLIGYVIE